jgi:hypothetical protein
LADSHVPADDANRPANCALLSRSTNAELGDRAPHEVFAALTPEQRRAAGAQLFGEEAGDRLKVDQYEEFCHWRAGRLAASINGWLGIG